MNGQRITRKSKGWFWTAFALSIAIAVGVGLWQTGYAGFNTSAQATTTPVYQTSTARRGAISLSISGTGNVVAAQTTNLSFSVAGKIVEMTVQVGDQVQKGQVIAQLELEQLEQNVSNQLLAVALAQKNWDDLQTQGSINLAEAYADLTSAQLKVEDAKTNLHNQGDSRCAPGLTQEYYFQWLYASKAADIWESYLADPNTGYGYDYLIEKVTPLRKARDQAYMNYQYCQSYTEQEIQQSHAALALAQAQLEKANTVYQVLQENGGVDPQSMKIAQAALDNAQLQLAKAREDLAGATIIAPVDGIVTAVNGKVGMIAGTNTMITLASQSDPQITVLVDETDLVNFAVGCPAQVTFDSLATQVFNGKIAQVSPVLATVQNVDMVQGQLVLDTTDHQSTDKLTIGLKGTVEITCSEAANTLIIPTQALYEPVGHPPFVYLLDSQGQPYQQEVEVGIKTAATVEILKGLTEGDQVVTTQINQP